MSPDRHPRFALAAPLALAAALLAPPPASRAAPAAAEHSLHEAIATLRAVGPEGKGNPAAGRAWATLASTPAEHLPRILAAMDGADARARNYLAAAAAAVADRQLQSGGALPLPLLGDFLLNTAQDGRARRLAFDLIARADRATAEALLPGLLDDPAPELRREAVQRVVDQALATLKDGRKEAATVLLQQALQFARDADQIDALAKPLKDLGRPVNLIEQFGFLTTWKVIGPFDNTGRAGFEKVFPPEQEIRLDAEYDGKEGKVRWKDFTTTHEYGMVDLNKAYAPLKEVTGYALTTFHSDAARPAQIRIGCKNGWKVWFNGTYLFGRDEYHRGAEIDQYRLPVELRQGANTLLVKLTQNEEKEEWTVEWEFQLRVTDPSGKVLRSNPPGARLAAAPNTSHP